MREPVYDDGWGKLYIGTALDVLSEMEDQSVHMAVTSPPYWGLRSYLPSEHPSKGQEIGTEKTPQEFVEKLVEVFSEVWRVLRDDGSLWVNIGDTYVGYWGDKKAKAEGRPSAADRNGFAMNGRPKFEEFRHTGLKTKDLCMVPARLAIALQDAGWYLRQEIVWAKDSAMPESVKDRTTRSHEMVYMLTKRPRYFYDQDAIREPHARLWGDNNGGSLSGNTKRNTDAGRNDGTLSAVPLPNPAGRNARSVWRINPKPYPGSHFAVFPPELPMRAIRAGTSERGVCSECGAPWRRVIEHNHIERGEARTPTGRSHVPYGTVPGSNTRGVPDRNPRTVGWEPTCTHEAPVEPAVVLDPFAGSGTTLMAAARLGRRSIGIDLDAKSAILTAERMGQPWLAPKEEGELVALEEGRLF